MPYLTRLSRTQYSWLIGTLIAAAGIVALGCALEPQHEEVSISSFTTEMSIREIAPKLDATGKALARELGLPVDVSKAKPLRKLDVVQDDLDHVAHHLLSHRSSQLNYYVFAALVLWALVFLIRLGRPDGSPVNLDFETPSILITTVVALVLALAVYRPFCQFICPFGFISWLAERLSLMRVRINRDLCTDCGAYVRACPSGAAKSKVKGGLFGADCYSCARCLNVCPDDAIVYRCVLQNE